MLIVNNEQAYNYHPIVKYIPKRLRKYFAYSDFSEIEEIRMRKGQPVIVHNGNGGYFIGEKGIPTRKNINTVIVTDDDIEEAMALISSSSLYAFEESLKKGFITIVGGNRIGISGHAEIVDGKIISISKFSGLNYRLAHEVIQDVEFICKKIINNGNFLNTLIISPPGCGKTTLLRNITKNLSYKGHKISIVDERNEISAMHDGCSGFDLGYSCDIIEGIGKKEGFSIMLRSMSPEFIITDELGCEEDIKTVTEAKNSGVCVIATAHAKNIEEIKCRSIEFFNTFECIVTLSRKNGPGTVEEIYFNA